eukprot:TRINITY_DN98512_c0_g1_i1.p2 TRINITY_DN98512_c0_g1~~TRINITY_DN98512_c0_g1_i1.p2  ORF type:complete len:117 (-),score=3.40 TRINITY_DN98512_c0_g1_i1:95-445(-)
MLRHILFEVVTYPLVMLVWKLAWHLTGLRCVSPVVGPAQRVACYTLLGSIMYGLVIVSLGFSRVVFYYRGAFGIAAYASLVMSVMCLSNWRYLAVLGLSMCSAVVQPTVPPSADQS